MSIASIFSRGHELAVATVISYDPLNFTAKVRWHPVLNGHPPVGFDVGAKLYAERETDALAVKVAALEAKVVELQAALAQAKQDSQRLDHLESECFTLQNESAGNDDVCWSVIGYRMGKPSQYVVTAASDPRDAVDQSIAFAKAAQLQFAGSVVA